MVIIYCLFWEVKNDKVFEVSSDWFFLFRDMHAPLLRPTYNKHDTSELWN